MARKPPPLSSSSRKRGHIALEAEAEDDTKGEGPKAKEEKEEDEEKKPCRCRTCKHKGEGKEEKKKKKDAQPPRPEKPVYVGDPGVMPAVPPPPVLPLPEFYDRLSWGLIDVGPSTVKNQTWVTFHSSSIEPYRPAYQFVTKHTSLSLGWITRENLMKFAEVDEKDPTRAILSKAHLDRVPMEWLYIGRDCKQAHASFLVDPPSSSSSSRHPSKRALYCQPPAGEMDLEGMEAAIALRINLYRWWDRTSKEDRVWYKVPTDLRSFFLLQTGDDVRLDHLSFAFFWVAMQTTDISGKAFDFAVGTTSTRNQSVPLLPPGTNKKANAMLKKPLQEKLPPGECIRGQKPHGKLWEFERFLLDQRLRTCLLVFTRSYQVERMRIYRATTTFTDRDLSERRDIDPVVLSLVDPTPIRRMCEHFALRLAEISEDEWEKEKKRATEKKMKPIRRLSRGDGKTIPQESHSVIAAKFDENLFEYTALRPKSFNRRKVQPLMHCGWALEIVREEERWRRVRVEICNRWLNPHFRELIARYRPGWARTIKRQDVLRDKRLLRPLRPVHEILHEIHVFVGQKRSDSDMKKQRAKHMLTGWSLDEIYKEMPPCMQRLHGMHMKFEGRYSYTIFMLNMGDHREMAAAVKYVWSKTQPDQELKQLAAGINSIITKQKYNNIRSCRVMEELGQCPNNRCGMLRGWREPPHNPVHYMEKVKTGQERQKELLAAAAAVALDTTPRPPPSEPSAF